MMLYPPWLAGSWRQFTEQYTQQRVAHAIILTGVPGLGQLALAEKMANLVLCEKETVTEPCGQCHNCQLFSAGNHPDHNVVSPEEEGKQIKIEQVRGLKQKQGLTASVSQWKTAILMPADAMNNHASNSLLKLLEEPQPNTLLILISSKLAYLPVTILSRCQNISLGTPSHEQGVDWLMQQGDFDSADTNKALIMANYGPLAALTLLSNGSLECLDIVSRDLNSLLAHKANPVQLAQSWQKYDLTLIFNHLQLRLRERIFDNTQNNQLSNNLQNWHIYDCILKTIKLLSSSNNINKVLLIEQFMVSAMDYNAAKAPC